MLVRRIRENDVRKCLEDGRLINQLKIRILSCMLFSRSLWTLDGSQLIAQDFCFFNSSKTVFRLRLHKPAGPDLSSEREQMIKLSQDSRNT